MRLRHIYDSISKGKQVYRSDQQYLENKLNFDFDKDKEILLLNEEIKPSKELPQETIQEKVLQIKPESKDPETMSKGLITKEIDPSNELTEIKQDIKTEEDKFESKKKLANEITLQRTKLSKLTQKR